MNVGTQRQAKANDRMETIELAGYTLDSLQEKIEGRRADQAFAAGLKRRLMEDAEVLRRLGQEGH